MLQVKRAVLACMSKKREVVSLVGWMLASLQVILIGVPGAFTPTCSTKHLPGFLENADEFKSKGVDTIACTRSGGEP